MGTLYFQRGECGVVSLGLVTAGRDNIFNYLVLMYSNFFSGKSYATFWSILDETEKYHQETK